MFLQTIFPDDVDGNLQQQKFKCFYKHYFPLKSIIIYNSRNLNVFTNNWSVSYSVLYLQQQKFKCFYKLYVQRKFNMDLQQQKFKCFYKLLQNISAPKDLQQQKFKCFYKHNTEEVFFYIYNSRNLNVFTNYGFESHLD